MTDTDDYKYPRSLMSLEVVQDPRTPRAEPAPVATATVRRVADRIYGEDRVRFGSSSCSVKN